MDWAAHRGAEEAGVARFHLRPTKTALTQRRGDRSSVQRPKTHIAGVRQGLRGWLILSFRLYQALLTRLAPGCRGRFGIDILTGAARVAASVMLSMAQGFVLLLLLHQPLTVWTGGWPVLHGLVVGFLWDEIGDPGGFRLGETIE